MLYKFNQTPANEDVKIEDFPKLSDVAQEETHGIVADLSIAIKANESEEKMQSCILPRTSYEYEKSNQVANLKALKDLPPPMTVDNSTTSLLTSKTVLECRFKAFDQSVFKIYSEKPRDESYELYHFMRIRQTQVYCGMSPQFKHIYILNTLENDANLIIFVPMKPG
jgi:hypothetical protein